MLAPGGSMAAIKAAVHNGADAVYFGVGSFNARANAENITSEQIAEIMNLLHVYSVKGYLALNILFSQEELNKAVMLAYKAWQSGIDAVIVQDMGLAAFLRREIPYLPVHASTQMTISDKPGIDMAANLGLKRVVLPRELSLESIYSLSRYASEKEIETEVFVHGALCICYSGQCLMSSVQNGRSANRGLCAQPCRLKYRIDSGHPGRLISPRDQALIEYLPQLIDAGVSSLKIEGRMKSEDYTSIAVAEYRKVLDELDLRQNKDAVFMQSPSRKTELKNRQECELKGITPDKERTNRFLKSFNRGGSFTDRYISGDMQEDFLTGIYPGSFGMELGDIRGIKARQGIIEIMTDHFVNNQPLKGDVLSIRRAGQDEEIASAPVGSVQMQGRVMIVKGFHPDIISRFRIGDKVHQMTDLETVNQLKKSKGKKTKIKMLLDVVDQNDALKLNLTVAVVSGIYRDIKISHELVAASADYDQSSERIFQQLKKTGSTPFEVVEIVCPYLDKLPLPITISDINKIRREAIDLITAKIQAATIYNSIIFNDDIKGEFVPEFKLSDTSTNYGIQSFIDKNNAQFIQTEQGEKSEKKPQQIDVWFQRLPDNPEDLACMADNYILPLWSLNQKTVELYIGILKDSEPECKIYAWLPPAPQNDISQWLLEQLGKLEAWGINGVCSGHPGTAFLPLANLDVQIDSSANISNSESCRFFLQNRPDSLAMSSELLFAQADNIRTNNDLSDLWGNTRFTIPVYGRQRLMSSAFCPVGKNLPGCRKCYLEKTEVFPDQSKYYQYFDSRKNKMILQTHPLFCSTDLLDSQLTIDSQAIEYIPDYAINWRLHFIDETKEERIALVKAFRNINNRKSKNELFEIVNKIAERLQIGVKNDRRQIYGCN